MTWAIASMILKKISPTSWRKPESKFLISEIELIVRYEHVRILHELFTETAFISPMISIPVARPLIRTMYFNFCNFLYSILNSVHLVRINYSQIHF